MTKRIFHSVCFAAISVLIASIILIMGVLYNYFSGLRKVELKNQLSLAVSAVELNGISYLEKTEFVNCRLTWIDKDGNVLFDSQSNSGEMENHLEREEIQNAFQTGSGESERFSSTLMQKTMYFAKHLNNDTVLRISTSQASVPALLIGILLPVTTVLIISITISFFLASRLSKRITQPLNSIDLDNPLENDVYDEISPLLQRISVQQKKIQNQTNELNQRKKEFEAITSSMNEGLVLLGKDRKIISLNPAAESFFSFSDECSGKPFIEIERNTNINKAISNAEKDGKGEVEITRNYCTYLMNISSIRNIGELSGYVILIFDITEKINAERRRREFTANVSHELKTPLQSIMGSAELMENGIVKKEDIPQFIGNIRRESERLLTLINDIIRLSKLDEGTKLPKQKFDLYALAQECVNRLMPYAENKNVTISLNGERIVINNVKPLVSEIIHNLVDNAIKYNKKGGKVDVIISADKIIIKDTGIGIPPEHQERIFERLYRVDKSRSKETGGTGLGLSIVKHAAEDIGATVQLKSNIGKGTSITVDLY